MCLQNSVFVYRIVHPILFVIKIMTILKIINLVNQNAVFRILFNGFIQLLFFKQSLEMH